MSENELHFYPFLLPQTFSPLYVDLQPYFYLLSGQYDSFPPSLLADITLSPLTVVLALNS